MNRAERRRQATISRKIQKLAPAARELAIATAMELYDANEDLRLEREQTSFKKYWDSQVAEFEEEVRKQILETTADGKEVKRLEEEIADIRRQYLELYLRWYAGGEPEPCAELNAYDVLIYASEKFLADRLVIVKTRVGKEIRHFSQPELLYGAAHWLATEYRDARRGVRSCPDLDASCRKACGFRYAAHQSEVTMGQHRPDYELEWGGRTVMLREHLRVGASFDPRHTARIAFFYDDPSQKVIIGYVGQHQANGSSN